ncbi:ABC transporter ATP-binding protein [Marinobacter nanhaiticus D15-8W]|uniref:ABC-type dipeptide transporter n=1 Tax=Marinobacter nanhaiticus D15-8W TaxID=626887 RepID=N6VYK0_9GAMM|nr:ABC transporter ATP-binding protein [Marinobacter nanhaiticus]ENO15325.1 ABC transporter ATP-binding protein [Marinobacter nanhaiticus D15-8W]BES73830.1 ABC transporter ATP-binding protein [Marinobacter nanhaiticus D15-8W]
MNEISKGIPLLDVQHLSVDFSTRNGIVRAIDDVSLQLAKGETLGIVGESGSGKSVTSYAVMRILDRAGSIANGRIVYGGMDIHKAREKDMRDLRGREISMIFQNPRAALNPIRKVGQQVADVLIQHSQATRSNAAKKAVDMLRAVKIRDPEKRFHAYPFELSGGMCQRVVIAIALACRPRLLIADEPTTGLDVTTQKAVMDLIVELTHEYDMATILITHDLGLAAAYCDRLVVMEKGQVIETNDSSALFHNPRQPYTRQLLKATPHKDSAVRDLLSPELQAKAMPLPESGAIGEPLLVVRNLKKQFGKPGAEEGHLAVKGLSFTLHQGESLGLVGESGCGKSTTSAMIMRLLDTTAGSIEFLGEDISTVSSAKFAAHPLRGKLQMVFQDPTDSLNPRWTAAQSIGDPLSRLASGMKRAGRETRINELAELVGLPTHLLDRFPHQLSGGQKARVGIARAIALEPRLLILDEPTAALDVSVQAVVLNLLEDLKHRLGMSYLFISHDLNVVRLLCDRIMVMQNGEIVEEGAARQLLDAPTTDYTRQLLAAIPHPPETAEGHARP